MRRGSVTGLMLATALVFAAPLARATDKWDFGPDDNWFTINVLVHGSKQTHDLQGAPDQDWMVVRSEARHSYEARVHSVGGYAYFYPGYYGTAVYGSTLTRVDYAGYLVTDSIPLGVGYYYNGDEGGAILRWLQGASTNADDFIRVQGPSVFAMGSNEQYDIEFFDTTYFAPRWNNVGAQRTVFLIQSQTGRAISGSIYFFDNAGVLLHTQALAVPATGVQVFATASVAALLGQSGAAVLAHDGGYGALSGKAVVLDPSTGFSFDTPFTPMPR